MTDSQIINLFQARNQSALDEVQVKYGGYCKTIAWNILENAEDTEECVSDALLKMWNAIPPAAPQNLRAFLGRITRNTALDIYENQRAAKRGGGKAEVVFSEVADIIGVDGGVEAAFNSHLFASFMNRFLEKLPKEQRVVLLRRYLYFHTISEIALDMGMTEGKTKSLLFRLRKKLKAKLEKEELLS